MVTVCIWWVPELMNVVPDAVLPSALVNPHCTVLSLPAVVSQRIAIRLGSASWR